jgi:hypothetical protein
MVTNYSTNHREDAVSLFALATRTIVVILAAALPGAARAECILDSPPQRAAMVELYTSEGCNSCPPADRWLSRLRTISAGQRIVALAFHVDYWNQLGWVDRFARPGFSERQRDIAARVRSRVIYTPQIVLDGKDLRNWSDSGSFDRSVAQLNREPAGARITGTAALSGTDLQLRGEVKLDSAAPSAAVWVAVFQNGLNTSVAAGENAGRTLEHDFVVRNLVGPLPLERDAAVQLDRTLQIARDWDVRQIGIAVFAQDLRTGDVLQAVSAAACL